MDQTLRFIIVSVAAYIIFLCIMRIILGTTYKTKSFRINLIGVVTVFGSFIIGRFGEQLNIPDYLIYIIPVLLIALLPTLSLDMKTNQTLKYLIFYPASIFLLHLLFSLLTGWNDLLPFIKIPSLWTSIFKTVF
ncbi:MAG: hypothetical protein GX957_14765 [Clostridiaceae bacterium]|nr:hypothetical protein [Clostridiaceae bacterium]